MIIPKYSYIPLPYPLHNSLERCNSHVYLHTQAHPACSSVTGGMGRSGSGFLMMVEEAPWRSAWT